MLWRKKLIGAKLEATYGTEAAIAAADVLLTRNFQITPLEATEVELLYDKPTYGSSGVELDSLLQRVTYEVMLSGSGTPTTAPAWARLLQACAFAAPAVGASSVTMALDTPTAAASLTQHSWIDTLLHKMVGSRGDMTFEFTNKQFPFIGLNYLGRIPTGALPAQAGAQVAATGQSTFKRPALVNKASTTFTLGGYAARLYSLKGALNNELGIDSAVGQDDEIVVKDRKVTGSILLQIPDPAAKNYWSDIVGAAATTIPLVITHGTTAGNIVELTMPKVQLKTPTYSEVEGKAAAEFQYEAVINAGNDELSIVTK